MPSFRPIFCNSARVSLIFGSTVAILLSGFVPEPREAPPLIVVEFDAYSCADSLEQGEGIKILSCDAADQMSCAEHKQVSPAVEFEVAGGLAAASQIVIRQSRTLAEGPGGAESAEIKQRFTQIEQDRLYSWLRILDTQSSKFMSLDFTRDMP